MHRRRPAPVGEPRRLLVVKLADIGDVLNTTPALRALRERYPRARIAVLTTRNGAQALARSPDVDEILTFDKGLFDRVGGSASPRALLAGLRFALRLRAGRYDTLVLLHHLVTGWGTLKYAVLALWSGARVRAGLDNGRGWFLTRRAYDRGFGATNERRYWLAVAATLGAPAEDDRPRFVVTDDDVDAAGRLLAPALRAPGQPVVVFHPTVGPYAPSRRWPAARFAAVADRLAREAGALPVFVGGQGDAAATAEVVALLREPVLDLAGKTDFVTLGGLLRRADLVIGNESSIGHLAAALGAPLLAVAGPSNDRAWAPYGAATITLPPDGMTLPDLPATSAVVLRCVEPRAPCLYTGYGPGNPYGCPHCHCLTGIDTDRVAALALRLLARSRQPSEPSAISHQPSGDSRRREIGMTSAATPFAESG
ncbi:MAG TPA: glycosyltransferase family 9 protein [Thermomicrobiales bacterium]|nr:glycosyltransferase family 9 protein [Thermomicrobiales bacterium]